MAPLRIAVTGGSGRIGHQVVKQLLERGHHVLNLDRKPARETLCKYVYIDLRHREQVQPVFEQVDAVCHLGEIPSMGTFSAEDTFAHNCQVGSVVMQTAADLKLKRLIYTSTCQTYGCWSDPNVPPLRLPFDETHPLQPTNAYALSKASLENYAQMVSRHDGLSIAIFRFPGVFAPQCDDDWSWLKKRTGRTDGMETYLHPDDAARAYVLAIENPRPGCEAYHFTADEVISGVPLRGRLLEHHPDFPVLPKDWPAYKSPALTDKAFKHFGWKASHNLMDIYRKKFGKEPHE